MQAIETYQSIYNLQHNADWIVYVSWLRMQKERWNQVLIDANDPDKRAVAAGMTRAISGLLEEIEAAPQKLTEYNRNA